MADEEAVLAEAASLPIDERAAHSNWKASADGNAAALDKALEALQAFLEKASDATASRIAGTVCSNIVGKSLGARPSTAVKGVDCLAAFVEVEQAEKVTTALVAGYSHKVPKVVVGALDATLTLVRSFGGRAMPAQQILKAMAGMFESKDAKARAIVKGIVAELARWMGPELIRAALFEKMRDAQKADVESLLAEAPTGRPKPERLTRKEAAKAAATAAAGTPGSAAEEGGEAAAAGGAAAAAVEEEPEQVDSYEFAEPRDIIPELKKDFWEGLESPKWFERKGALTTLKELASYPRLAHGDYGDVNRELKKIICKDSHIQVVSEAMNCIAAICKGLRKDYRGASMTFCSVVLEKFKDKAAVVGKAAAEALDAMARYSFSLVDVAEDVAAALGHQHPKVKENTLIWLAGCVTRETKAAAVKLVAGVVPAAAKCTDEGAPSIREAAFSFLVQLALKAGSLGALEKGLSKMDEAKRKKLEELLQEAAKARRAGGAAAAPSTAAALSRGSSSRSLRAPASGGPSPLTSPRGSTTGHSARPAATAGSRSTAVRGSGTGKPPAGAGRASKPAAAASAGAGGGAGDDGVVDESALSGGLLNAHEAKTRLSELLGEEMVAALADPLWKIRLEAMESVVAKAQDPEAAGNVQTLVQGMAHLPGWEDKNFQVMSRQFEVVRCCAAYPSFGKTEALLKEGAFQMLLAAAEAVGPQLVASLLHKRAAAHKNPKVLTEAINWVTLAVNDFLLPAFNVAVLLGWAKEDLGSANAATRTAAVQMLGCLHTFLGPPLGDMVRADLKPALMATVEAEFAKQPQQSDFTANRVSRVAAATRPAGGARKGGAKGSAAAAAEEPPSMDDLLPRADISGQISSELVGKLTSANWKERKEALDEVEAILAAAGGRIQPCVGDLMPALKGRFNDSNKNLIAVALSLLAKLARAMGRAIVREARPVLGPALRCLCDSKSFVRAAVVEMLEAWASVAPCDAPFEELLEILPSPKCVSEGMQAAISWMASVYSGSSSSRASSNDAIAAAVKAVAVGAGYKTVPVREAAGQLMEALVTSVGAQAVQGAVQGLDKSLQKTAADALAKAGAAVGPGPAMPAAAGGGSRPGTAGAAGRPASRPGTASSRPTAGASGAASRPGTAGSGAAARSSMTASSSMGRGSVAASSAAGLVTAYGGGDDGPLLSIDRNKEDRARKAEELQSLEAELGPLAAPSLRANLFAKDFQKHILGAEALRAWISGRQDDSVHEACVACLDLLLRWAVVRLAEGNTKTLVGVTGMLKALFDLLAEQGYRLSEAEVKVYMPGLVEKCGQPTPQMKAECRDLIRRVSSLYPPTKVIAFLQEGLSSKNNRTRVTCAEEISYLVDREGPRVYSGAKCDVLPVLAKLVSEPGKEIRAAALEALGMVYTIEGDAFMKRLGNLNSQQQGILGDRLKTVDRDLAKKGLAAGYRRAEFDAMRGSISTDTSTVAGAGGFDQTAAAGAAAAGGYAAAGNYVTAGGMAASAAAAMGQAGAEETAASWQAWVLALLVQQAAMVQQQQQRVASAAAKALCLDSAVLQGWCN
ncbi:armadillo-type protein [Scenedesmus sp. NREL 46B-D3]|nr:armadillo-type protein [Scenedesmus sp. NREL 46B-D3]